jgi:hypothetical protein
VVVGPVSTFALRVPVRGTQIYCASRTTGVARVLPLRGDSIVLDKNALEKRMEKANFPLDALEA